MSSLETEVTDSRNPNEHRLRYRITVEGTYAVPADEYESAPDVSAVIEFETEVIREGLVGFMSDREDHESVDIELEEE